MSRGAEVASSGGPASTRGSRDEDARRERAADRLEAPQLERAVALACGAAGGGGRASLVVSRLLPYSAGLRPTGRVPGAS